MRSSLTLIPVLVYLCLGCGPRAPVTPEASFPAKSTLALTTPRCSGGKVCACRALDSGEGQAEEAVPAGRKRFEFRLPRTVSAIWVAVEGQGVFYKPAEAVLPTCFYLDLAPGEHRVTVHGEKRDPEVGLQLALAVNEYGAKEGPHWYRTLDFVCGDNANTCVKESLEHWVAFQRKLPRGVLDPCGSTMVRGVNAGGTREERLLPDYRELTLHFVMKIYSFETFRTPGSSECRAPVKNL